MNRYYVLNKDMDHLKKWKKAFMEGKQDLSSLKSQFWFRQKQLIAELAYIYPIKVKLLGEGENTPFCFRWS